MLLVGGPAEQKNNISWSAIFSYLTEPVHWSPDHSASGCPGSYGVYCEEWGGRR